MMQFTEIPTLFLQPQPNSIPSYYYYQTTMLNKTPQTSTIPTTFATKPWHTFPTQSKLCVPNNYLSGNTNCIEQFLLHCADAIENNDDPTSAQQLLCVLNNISPSGNNDSNQRLTRAFLRALILRATLNPTYKFIYDSNNDLYSLSSSSHCGNYNNNKLSLLEVANFVHLTPWYRFGFTASNLMIMDAVEKYNNGPSNSLIIHIVDISITQCMQIPTLIDLISTRFQPPQSPPFVRLTVGVVTEHVPPMFNCVSYEDVGLRLINFARSRGVVLEFNVVHTTPLDGFASLVDQVRHQQHHGGNLHYPNDVTQEMLVVNCQMTLHYLQQHDEFGNDITSPRSMFLKEIRNLDPDMVIIVEEDVDFTSNNLVERLKSAFNYFWIPFDTLDTFLPKGNKERECYEADICWKIENVITYEGGQRVERQEPWRRWVERMVEAGFRTVVVGEEEAAAEVKAVVGEHGVGWGSKKEEDHLVLTWKGHNVAFASAWIPS